MFLDRLNSDFSLPSSLLRSGLTLAMQGSFEVFDCVKSAFKRSEAVFAIESHKNLSFVTDADDRIVQSKLYLGSS